MSVVTSVMEFQSRSIQRLSTQARIRSLKFTKDRLVELKADLLKLEPGSWGYASRTSTMRQVQVAVSQLARGQVDLLKDGLAHTARVSTKDASRTLRSLDYHYGGIVRPLRFDRTDWITSNAHQMSRVRLREFSQSFARYGANAVVAIENEVAKAILTGEPWTAARNKVMKATRHVVGDRMWMVDRILRSEISAAYNGSQLAAMMEEDFDTSDPMMKRLVATFDDVTGMDSIMLHGQTKPVREPFVDPYFGRTYMAPPNRPNDREVIVPWRSSYGESFPGGGEGYVKDTASEDAYGGVARPRGKKLEKEAKERLEALRAKAKKPQTLTQIRKQLIRGQLHNLHRQLTRALSSRKAMAAGTAEATAMAIQAGNIQRIINALESERRDLARLSKQLRAARAKSKLSMTVAQAAKRWGVSSGVVNGAILRRELAFKATSAGVKYVASGAFALWLIAAGYAAKESQDSQPTKVGREPATP